MPIRPWPNFIERGSVDYNQQFGRKTCADSFCILEKKAYMARRLPSSICLRSRNAPPICRPDALPYGGMAATSSKVSLRPFVMIACLLFSRPARSHRDSSLRLLFAPALLQLCSSLLLSVPFARCYSLCFSFFLITRSRQHPLLFCSLRHAAVSYYSGSRFAFLIDIGTW